MFFAHRRRKKSVGMSDITKSSEEPEFVKEIRTEKTVNVCVRLMRTIQKRNK